MNIFNVLELDDRMRSLEDVFSFNEVVCSTYSMCLILSVYHKYLL
jgi:hypothetical protein